MPPEVIELLKWLGTAAIGVFGALKAWQAHLDFQVAKAKENSAGAEAIKELKKEMHELKEDFRDVIMMSRNRR